MAVNERFLRTLHAARQEAGVPVHSAMTLLYRRAVPTDARAGLASPSLPVPGLRPASNGVAVLVPHEFPGGRVTRESVDAALHAARAAGMTWAAAWVSSEDDAAVLRALDFVAFDTHI